MEISNQTIDKLANLAQLQFSDTEKESIKNDLEKMVGFIEQLQKIDTKRNESPLLHIVRDLHLHVQSFTKDHYDFDIIGNFYGEHLWLLLNTYKRV